MVVPDLFISLPDVGASLRLGLVVAELGRMSAIVIVADGGLGSQFSFWVGAL